ncbi:helix-turn-helix transcriptional regulator [Streptomyces goshikiensis]|uniref:helix-turn-helix transcriptional regulator n=1 Tax=Streptomyces goshikiensis TaxID=1942 RepID=UPI0036C36FDB
MPQHERHGADELAHRVRLAAPAWQPAAVPQALREALASRRVLRLSYSGAQGAVTERCVEPPGYPGGEHWYLIGWCRRRCAVRGVRLDRVRHVEALAETVPPRALDLAELDRLGWEFIGLDELVNTDRGLSPEA